MRNLPENQVRFALNYGLSGVPFWNGMRGLHGGLIGTVGLPFMAVERQLELIPYTYTYWSEAHRSGAPIVRAMVLEYQSNPETHDIDDQFLYGDAFLVAPIIGPGEASWRNPDPYLGAPRTHEAWRRVYVPPGEWVDYLRPTKRYLGPGWQYLMARQADAVILVRGGAIIPEAPVLEYIEQGPMNPLTLAIYPYKESHFTLYEDDGDTYAYEKGASATTVFTCRERPGGIEFEIGATQGSYNGMPSVRDYRLKVHGTTRPASITVNGNPLAECGSREAWEAAKTGWWFHHTVCNRISP